MDDHDIIRWGIKMEIARWGYIQSDSQKYKLIPLQDKKSVSRFDVIPPSHRSGEKISPRLPVDSLPRRSFLFRTSCSPSFFSWHFRPSAPVLVFGAFFPPLHGPQQPSSRSASWCPTPRTARASRSVFGITNTAPTRTPSPKNAARICRPACNK